MRKIPSIYVTYALLFFAALYFSSVYMDPDFGWRLRLGGEILSSGIPLTDPYSYTMPSFKFIDHEWATHAGMAVVYAETGYIGLGIIATILYISTLFLITRIFNRDWKYGYVLMAGTVLLHYFGVKPQLISWFLAAIFTGMILSRRWDTRWRTLTPLLFLVWANLHGGFVFGVIVYTLKLIAECVEKKRVDRAAIAWYLSAIAATFVNPYTYRLWEEIIRTGSDARLRVQVLEWTPQFVHMSVSSLFLVAWYMTIFGKYFRKTSTYEKLIIVVVFIFGFSSSRNFPLWIVAATPIIARLMGLFVKDAQKNAITRERIRKLSIGFAIVMVAVAVFELFFLLREMRSYRESERYPAEAITFMRKNQTRGNVIAAYEWGGYLIWKYPEKKVFIDGRMPSWKQDASAHPGESADALGEFTMFLAQQKPMGKLISKYNIDTILLPRKYFTKGKNKRNTRSIEKFETALKKNGFRPVYADDLAVIYR